MTIAIVAGLGARAGCSVERWVEPFVFETRLRGQVDRPTAGLTFDQRIQMGAEEVGTDPAQDLALPAGRHRAGRGHPRLGPRPTSSPRYAGPDNPFGVLVAVAIGIPLYSNAAGIMPLVEALHDKGMPMGTLLAFMMAVVALSLPEMILLRRVLKPKLLAALRRRRRHRHRRRRLPVQRHPGLRGARHDP